MKFSFEEFHIWQQFANALICDRQVLVILFHLNIVDDL